MEQTWYVAMGHAVERIVEFCKEGGFDLLVTGFTGHSRLYERIWGGVSRNLARFSPCAVLIEKERHGFGLQDTVSEHVSQSDTADDHGQDRAND